MCTEGCVMSQGLSFSYIVNILEMLKTSGVAIGGHAITIMIHAYGTVFVADDEHGLVNLVQSAIIHSES